MNGIKLLGRKSLFPLFSLILIVQAQAINIWPDRVEPTVRLDEAVALAQAKIGEIESDNLFCVNATLLNGENEDTATGYWLVGFATEIGNNYSVAVRMDRKLDVNKVSKFQFNMPNHWPETITPAISVIDALSKAEQLLKKKGKSFHYCLNASLIAGSDDVMADGMWNFVFQSTTDDPLLVNIRMNGKTNVKGIQHLKEYQGE